jgi:hypothetical protein
LLLQHQARGVRRIGSEIRLNRSNIRAFSHFCSRSGKRQTGHPRVLAVWFTCHEGSCRGRCCLSACQPHPDGRLWVASCICDSLAEARRSGAVLASRDTLRPSSSSSSASAPSAASSPSPSCDAGDAANVPPDDLARAAAFSRPARAPAHI